MIWLGDNLYFQQPDLLDPVVNGRALSATARVRAAAETAHRDGAHRDLGRSRLRPEQRGHVVRDEGRIAAAVPALLGQSELRTSRRAAESSASRAGATSTSSCSTIAGTVANRLPDGPDKTMFGAQQLEWLKQRAASIRTAPVKLVANGSQFWNRGDSLRRLESVPAEQKAFARLAARAADRRRDVPLRRSPFRRIARRSSAPGAYPLYEFTSSPLTSRPCGNARGARSARIPMSSPGTLVGSASSG